MRVIAIPSFSDNIIWGLCNDRAAALVDPGDAAPARTWLEDNGLVLEGILITHHHADHVGGVDSLCRYFGVRDVYGPAACRPHGVTQPVMEGSIVSLPLLGLHLRVMEVPGHTLDHIAFCAEPAGEAGMLFCGDTLFAAGCGRLLGGEAKQLWESLQTLARLPATTRIFCAHEYTVANLHFAASEFPNDAPIRERLQKCQAQRLGGAFTLPSTLSEELLTNPFLRAGNLTDFAAMRARKDVFRAPSG
ncbi:MAG: hydroxyacylglutathione hydrolase [Betaproteobacteria bacterium]|nr:hydroxyacylglutathione hydrolase [Betaproteobacteria bacterium]NCA16870.1 hydroxyacylglutathione hydrolase [Betaproteobacteria bacterium]